MDWFDYKFWLAVAGATAFKLLTSPWTSLTKAAATVLAAVLSAWAFTDIIIKYLALDPVDYKVPVAALLALTGESAMRWLMAVSPEKLIFLWRNGK